MKRQPRPALCPAALVVVALAASAHAQSTWNGTTNTNWATATNWAPGIPAEGDNVTIADTTTNGLTSDTSHTIGSLIFGTTRTTGFTLNTQAANNLTIDNGVIASGNFPAASANAFTMRGHYVVPTGLDQTWSVSGSASHNTDQGVFIREITTGATNRGSLTLNANLTKVGSGQLLFAAIDLTGDGNLIVDAGDVKFNAGASQPLVVGGTGNVTANGTGILAVYKNSGTLNITRQFVLNDTATLATRNSVDLAAPIEFNGTHNLDVGGTPTNLTGAWTGTGTVNKIGAGTANLSGTSGAFAGALNVNAGRVNLNANQGGNLTVGGAGALGGEATVGGNLTLNGGNLHLDPTTPGALNCTGNLLLTGTNTVNLVANPLSSAPFAVVSYSGTKTGGGAANLTLAGGAGNYRTPTFDDTSPGVITLALGAENRTWNGGAAWDINGSPNWLEGDNKFYQLDHVTFGDTGAGTVAVTGTVIPSSITVNTNSDYTFTMATAAVDLIAGAGTLTKSGTGTLTLGGANTFTGNVTINAGTLKPTNNQALGANGKTITVAAGATLDTNGAMNANRDYQAVIAGSGVDGFGAIVNSGVDRQNGFGSITLSGNATIGGLGRFDLRPISAGTAFLDLAGFTLTKGGTNKIALVDGSLTNPGTIQLNQGTLSFTRMVVSGAGNIHLNSGATLQLENNTSGSFSKPLAIDGGLLWITGNAFTVDSPVTLTNIATIQTDVALTLTGAIDGTGTLTKTGASTLILAGNATHTGGTTVNAGTLQIGNAGTTGTLNADITNTGTVTFNRSDDLTYSNVVSGTGTLTKLGTGTLTLATAQAYAGLTTVSAGTLKLGLADALPIANPLTITNALGATLDLNGLQQEVRSLAGGGTTGGIVSNSGASTATLTIRPTLTDSVTWSGVIAGDVRVVVIGNNAAPSYTAPRQRFAGTASTYTGGTVVDGATLLVRLDGSLGAVPPAFDPANITLQNNGTLLNEANGQVLTLDPNRGITLGPGGGALVGGFDQDVTVQGAITGAAGNHLTIMANNRTVILTADNNYAGDTIIEGTGAIGIGRLRIGNGGTTGTLGSGNVTNNGQLSFNRSDSTSYNGVISGTGTLTQLGTGTLTLNGANTYSGNTTVSAGTLELGTTGTLRFVPTTNGTSNKLVGATPATTNAVIKGTFTIDTTNAAIANGNSWTLVDTATLAVDYDEITFKIPGFSQAADVWTKPEGAKTWTFEESTGVLSLVATGFYDWIDDFIGLADTTPGGDPDFDGITNLLEYVLNGDPSTSDTDVLPDLDASGSNFVFSFTRREESATDTAQLFQYGSTLTAWTPVNITAPTGPEVTLGTPSGGLQLVTVTIPKSAAVGGKLFGRLVVSQP